MITQAGGPGFDTFDKFVNKFFEKYTFEEYTFQKRRSKGAPLVITDAGGGDTLCGD